MAKFEAKFWGTKEKRGQLKKVVENVEATDKSSVESLLYACGYMKVNGLKIREINERTCTVNNMD